MLFLRDPQENEKHDGFIWSRIVTTAVLCFGLLIIDGGFVAFGKGGFVAFGK